VALLPQIKSAVLLAGLAGSRRHTVIETEASRDTPNHA